LELFMYISNVQKSICNLCSKVKTLKKVTNHISPIATMAKTPNQESYLNQRQRRTKGNQTLPVKLVIIAIAQHCDH